LSYKALQRSTFGEFFVKWHLVFGRSKAFIYSWPK
jgi:hypothetical protein